MTHKGEQMTYKGEFQNHMFKGKKTALSVWYCKGSSLSIPSEMPHLNGWNTHLPLYQMVFVLKGKLSCSIKTARKPFATLEQQQHNLIFACPEELVLNSITEEPHEIIFIHISAEFLSRYLPLDHPAGENLFSKYQLHLTPEINSILNSLENSSHTGFCGKLFLESKVIELLAIQISQSEAVQKDIPLLQLKADELERMQQVREILISNLHSQLSLRTLAHMVGTNEFNLKRQFKAAFGTTVYGYLNQYKMEQAKALLIQGDSRVAEVSGKMGYKHATHFTSAFKKYFGYLPNKIKMFMLVFDPEFCLVLFST